jgi:hypothetical protein
MLSLGGYLFLVIDAVFSLLMIFMILIFYKTASVFRNLLLNDNTSAKLKASFVIWFLIILMIFDIIYWVDKSVSWYNIYKEDPPRYTI